MLELLKRLLAGDSRDESPPSARFDEVRGSSSEVIHRYFQLSGTGGSSERTLRHGTGSFHVYADSPPEHRLVHDPDAIPPCLLGLS
jgi:hypothetical protein